MSPFTHLRRNARRVATSAHQTLRRDHGQTLAVFALMSTVLVAVVGLSVDVGQIVVARTDLQKTSDAAALAGSQELPVTLTAELVALDYVDANASSPSSAEVSFSATHVANDTITVESKRTVNFVFLKAIGIGSMDVSATASVNVAHYVGGTGVLPWGFIADPGDPTNHLLGNSCFNGFSTAGLPQFKTNMKCTLKYGAGDSGGGDFGALAIDNTGGATYREAIKNGSTSTIKKGDKLEPQTGNLAGPTLQGVGDRLAQVSSSCDQKSELVRADGFGGYYIDEDCATSPNLIVIPVVDQIDDPHLSTVLGFAFMWLQGTSNKGGHQSIVGEFLYFAEELPNGVYEGFGDGPRSTALIE